MVPQYMLKNWHFLLSHFPALQALQWPSNSATETLLQIKMNLAGEVFNFHCVSLCVSPQRTSRKVESAGFPGAGVTDGYELLHVGDGNQTQALWESSVFLTTGEAISPALQRLS